MAPSSTEEVGAEVLDLSLAAVSAGLELPSTTCAAATPAAAAAAAEMAPGPAACAPNDAPLAKARAAAAVPPAAATAASPVQVVAGNTIACVSEQAVAAEAGVVRQSSKFSPLYWFTRAQPTNYDM